MRLLGIITESKKTTLENTPEQTSEEEPLDDDEEGLAKFNAEKYSTEAYIPDYDTLQHLLELGMQKYEKQRKQALEFGEE